MTDKHFSTIFAQALDKSPEFVVYFTRKNEQELFLLADKWTNHV